MTYTLHEDSQEFGDKIHYQNVYYSLSRRMYRLTKAWDFTAANIGHRRADKMFLPEQLKIQRLLEKVADRADENVPGWYKGMWEL